MSQVGADGIITSRDVRLNLDVSNSLSASDEVLIMNTFGYPGELQDKVLQGPYGIYVEGMPELDAPIVATLQSKDVSSGKIQFWNGQNWSTLPADIEGDVATFTFSELGVIVLTE
jgi:hypothetical protein